MYAGVLSKLQDLQTIRLGNDCIKISDHFICLSYTPVDLNPSLSVLVIIG